MFCECLDLDLEPRWVGGGERGEETRNVRGTGKEMRKLRKRYQKIVLRLYILLLASDNDINGWRIIEVIVVMVVVLSQR